MLVLSICLFVFISAIPASVIKVESAAHNSTDAQVAERKVSVHSRTLQDSIVVDVFFPQPTVTDVSSYATVEMDDLPTDGAPGEPILPSKTIKILIPQHKTVHSVSVAHGDRKFVDGEFRVDYGKTAVPLSSKETVVDKPNPRIYSSSNPFPGTTSSDVSEQCLRGYEVLALTLYPVQYVPASGKLFYYETVTVTINMKDESQVSPLQRNLPEDRALIETVVDNPYDAATYAETADLMRPTNLTGSSGPYQYVVITNNNLNSSFQPLIDRKIEKGLTATTVLVENITSDPDYFSNGFFGDGTGAAAFNDTAARIRNFIKDAYVNWGTEYVLLGGDTQIIPARGVAAYVGTTYDPNLACDLYYGALDGSWNKDNDTLFGEHLITGGSPSPDYNGTAGEEADFFAEVYVGRSTVDATQEASNFVNKTLWYEKETDENYFKKALMIGEHLDEQTEGGNGKDAVSNAIPQYTTTRLYSRDGMFSASLVISKLNSGMHVVNHDGHSNEDMVMGMSRSDVDALTNTEYCLIYSLGCYSAAFDLRAHAIAEEFICTAHGAFAYVGNTRYGWYVPGSMSGPGETYDEQFFKVLNGTERHLGKTLQRSKENLYGSGVHRWTYFTLVLLGDPEVEIVTELKKPTAHIQTNPTAKRMDPAVLKGLVNITGLAQKGKAAGATFKNYTLQYGIGTGPTTWYTTAIALANDGQSEVENDVLGTWNTSKIESFRTYTLKLTVYDADGVIGEDRWIIDTRPLPTIQVNPTATEMRVGQNFKVQVNITDVEALYELDINLTWDAALVDCTNHRVTIPREDNPGGVLYKPVQITRDEMNESAGTYRVAAKSVNPASSFNGSGMVFELAFDIKAEGDCSLDVVFSNLTDKSKKAVYHEAINSIVRISPGIHDVAVEDVSVSKTVVCQGLSIDVNVTAENRGSYNETFAVTTYANATVLNTTQVSLAYYSSTRFIFAWNTAGFPLGDYTVNSTATPVSGETNLTDNTFIYSSVTIIEPSYDVAVTGLNFSKTILGKGYFGTVNVTVENQADLTTTFNVTVYADVNTTVIGDEVVIGIQEVTMTGKTSRVLTFRWDTTLTPYGNYTVSGYAVPLEAEADREDNLCMGGCVVVSIAGDMDGELVNGHFGVSLYDAVRLLACYGSKEGDPLFNPNCDIDETGQVFLFDAVILLNNYGQKTP
ncbi:C25 family cysteine peptidase [Candidatus Bathyarchaeota archaeon]|jgi:hypothetical protein|nr:C25 family cysteine peptidase [Candidatus Bathyarchaeota archaeon]